MQRSVASPYGFRKLVRNLINKNSSANEHRLKIDLLDAPEAYGNGDVSDIGWVRSGDVLADALIKESLKR